MRMAVRGNFIEPRKSLAEFPFFRLREKVAEGRMRVFSQLLHNCKHAGVSKLCCFDL